MARRLLAAFVLLAAGAAQAQPNTVTCRSNGYGVTTCAPTFPTAPPAQTYTPQSSGVAAVLLGAYLSSRRDARAQKAAETTSERALVVQNSVTYYMGEGKCDTALEVAVANGRVDLAEKVRTACVSR